MCAYFMTALLTTSVMAASAMVDAPTEQAFDGKVVSTTLTEITVSASTGQTLQTFAVPASTKVTLNGKPAVLMELMMGDAVKITMNGRQIKSIEATRNIKVSSVKP